MFYRNIKQRLYFNTLRLEPRQVRAYRRAPVTQQNFITAASISLDCPSAGSQQRPTPRLEVLQCSGRNWSKIGVHKVRQNLTHNQTLARHIHTDNNSGITAREIEGCS